MNASGTPVFRLCQPVDLKDLGSMGHGEHESAGKQAVLEGEHIARQSVG
jgi:hypothetical protein